MPLLRRQRTCPRSRNEKCFKCHDDPEMTAEADGRSMAVIEAEFKTGAHKRLDCVQCPHRRAHHQAPAQRPRSGLVRRVHGVPRGRDQPVPDQRPRQGQGRQAGHVPRLPRQHPHHAAQQQPGCTDVRREPGPPLRRLPRGHDGGYLSSVHARALFVAGLTEASPACSDCHGSHDIQRHDAEGARTSHAKSPETCGACHQGVLKEWDESAHGALWREGKDGPVCSTCHEAHAIERPTTSRRGTHAQRLRELPCRSLQVVPRQFPRQVGERRPSVGAMCSDCHTPHHNLPASDPRSSTHADNLAATCARAAATPRSR